VSRVCLFFFIFGNIFVFGNFIFKAFIAERVFRFDKFFRLNASDVYIPGKPPR
jgi:hypothetical protein